MGYSIHKPQLLDQFLVKIILSRQTIYGFLFVSLKIEVAIKKINCGRDTDASEYLTEKKSVIIRSFPHMTY